MKGCNGIAAIAAGVWLIGGGWFTAAAQTCGSVITASTRLRANIGPCAGTGLVIPDGARNITLDLNGFTITGTKTGGSAGILSQGAMIFITGPGTITNFDTGIVMQRLAAQKFNVENVRLKGNRIGINLLSSYSIWAGDNRILKNRIEGPGEIGIRNDGALFTLYSENWISGQTVAGMALFNGHSSTIEKNTIRNNKSGVYLNGYSEPSLIRNNDVSSNDQDGIVAISQVTIADNVVSGNGRDGIAVAGPAELETLITGNFVMNNGRRGIAVGNVDPPPAEPLAHSGAGTVRVTDNFTWINRSLDLFWDTTGPYNCWSGNRYARSYPTTLPSCK